MKLNLRKISFLAILAVGLLTFSCQKEDIEIVDTEAVVEEQVKPEVAAITYNYKYHYDGQIYNEQDWETKFNSMNNPDLSMIGLNDVVYVFEDASKAQSFQDGELQVLMDNMSPNPSLSTEDTNVGSGEVRFKIQLWKKANYVGTIYTFNYVETITRMRNNWGGHYLLNNEYERNLPSAINDLTVAYKITLIKNTSVINMTNGSLTSGGIPLLMYVKLRMLNLGAGGVEWSRTLSGNSDVDQDNDLSNNTISASFGVLKWANQFSSFTVKFI